MEITSYMILLIGLSITQSVAAFYILLQPNKFKSPYRVGAMIMLAGAIWLLASTLEVGSDNLQIKLLFRKTQYIGVVMVPIMWFILALQLTHRENWLKRRNLVLLIVIPIATLLIIFTNDFHGLYWSSIALNAINPFFLLIIEPGLWFGFFLTYSYILILVGTIVFIQGIIQSNPLYRRQATPLLLVVLIPWIFNMITYFYPDAFPYFDPTPLAVTICTPILIWRLISLRATDIMPMAHGIIFNRMRDAVILLDSKNNIVEMNSSTEKLIGRRFSEVIGQPIEKVWIEWSGLAEDFSNRTEINKEVVFGKGDDQRIYDLRMSFLTGIIDRLGGRLIIMRDITERNRAEKAMRRAKEEETRMRIMDRLISTATHELRTPLVSIKGYLDRVISGKVGLLPEKVASELEVVKRNTDRLLSLTNDLLDVRRMESGKLELNIKPMDLQEIIQNCTREIQPFIEQKKQRFNLKVPKGRLSIQGDIVRLSQALMNLLDNASKFTPEGGKIVLNVVAMKKSIQVQIKDTGIGIRKKDLERIFEPFVNIEKSIYFKGTGLGLSVTKGLVEAHGGKIWAESSGEGKGATFSFTLPKLEIV
ncbi:MAG: ATP-binding protein [Candidatus Bathyarchaeota archaeon]|nr:ATP-binding protein [Candidatus Bathyarchaeota archaeon]